MCLKLKFVLHFLMSLSVINVDGLKCYVCGDDGELPCDDFDMKRDTFIQECLPPNNLGCEMVVHGRNVTRKCSDKSLKDCGMANGVEYCYCKSGLCNSNISIKLGYPSDDEDLEGSGIRTISTTAEKPVVVTKDKSSAVKIDMYCSLVVTLFLAMIYNN